MNIRQVSNEIELSRVTRRIFELRDAHPGTREFKERERLTKKGEEFIKTTDPLTIRNPIDYQVAVQYAIECQRADPESEVGKSLKALQVRIKAYEEWQYEIAREEKTKLAKRWLKSVRENGKRRKTEAAGSREG